MALIPPWRRTEACRIGLGSPNDNNPQFRGWPNLQQDLKMNLDEFLMILDESLWVLDGFLEVAWSWARFRVFLLGNLGV